MPLLFPNLKKFVASLWEGDDLILVEVQLNARVQDSNMMNYFFVFLKTTENNGIWITKNDSYFW